MRCTYCAFNVYTDQTDLFDAYVDAVVDEIGWLGREESFAVHTIYFGGGTPSLLTIGQIGRILEAVNAHTHLSHAAEISLEANPGTIDHAYFTGLYGVGVNRLSLGMQSAHADQLALFGRLHSAAATQQAMYDARRAGFENISLDLIYGAPQQTRLMWQASLQHAVSLAPNHFSLYALILKPGTDITRRIKYGELPSPDDDLVADMYDDATDMLAAASYDQYELSSWGRPSRHNLQYWRNLPYLGVGAGAHGYARGTRTVNAMRPEIYIRQVQTQPEQPGRFPATPATIKHETIDVTTDMAETLFMGLRLLQEGVTFEGFARRYNVDLQQRFSTELERLVARGLLQMDSDGIRLTQQARLISNVVFREFLADE